MYEIESGIPVPKKLNVGSNRKGKSKYPFARMVSGDSFRAPIAFRNRLTQVCAIYNRQHQDSPTRLTLRKIDDEFVGVWCVDRTPQDMEDVK